jgi:uncharacterized protein (TIGR03084 family)
MGSRSPDVSFVDVLEAEQRDLHRLLEALAADDWARPTPAAGWDVRDQVSHLAHTEEVALDTLTGGPRNLAAEVERCGGGDAFTEWGCDQGRGKTPHAVLDWWWQASGRMRAGLRQADTAARVRWGLGMSWRSFVTARLMEHWAHGLDVRAAVGAPAPDTDRLQHVAWIGVGALPYAFSVAGVEPPEGHTLRVELVGPAGQRWAYGPPDATDLISGPAGQWCRVAVQRLPRADAHELKGEGPLAKLALDNARAFL